MDHRSTPRRYPVRARAIHPEEVDAPLVRAVDEVYDCLSSFSTSKET